MKHNKLRILTGLQHWLGSNYADLPTDSGTMTARARLYLKEHSNTFDELSDQILKKEKATALLAVVMVSVCQYCKKPSKRIYDEEIKAYICDKCKAYWQNKL